MQFFLIDPSSLVSCVGEGWVQAGLRPSQRRLREAGSAASTCRSAEHFLEGAKSETLVTSPVLQIFLFLTVKIDYNFLTEWNYSFWLRNKVFFFSKSLLLPSFNWKRHNYLKWHKWFWMSLPMQKSYLLKIIMVTVKADQHRKTKKLLT